ncbi:MAG: SUMF1/EgtB/PvdO family nonheme iron enzyme [Cyanobacteria bacterium P01_D01_bin.36]
MKVAPEYLSEVNRSFENLGISQEVLATRTGLSRKTVSTFLSGKNVRKDTFVKLCEKIKVKPDDVREKTRLTLREQLKLKIDEIGDLIDVGASEAEIDAREQEFKELKKKYKRNPQFTEKDQIIGRYKLKKLIDSGGFASVWRAADLTLKRKVAVKVLHSYYANLPSYREDFLESAEAMQTLNQLKCPNVVTVTHVPDSKSNTLLDFDSEVDSCYFVMDLVEGGNLYEAVLDGECDLSEDRFFKIIDDVSKALIYSHKHGIIHKDIKPQNILIGNDSSGYLTDFNLVVMKSESEQVSSSSAIGTYIYSPPEVLGYEEVDHRGDIYSLGMTMMFGLYRKHLPPEALINPRSFIDKRIDCAPELKGVLLKAIEFNPEQRYETMEKFHTALSNAWKNRNQQLIKVLPPKNEEHTRDVSPKFLDMKPFDISKFPVTNTEFSRFVEHGGYTKEGLQTWWSPIGREVWHAYQERDEHPHMSRMRREDEPAEYPLFWSDQKYNHPAQPVVGVSWYEAEAYCNWLLSTMRVKAPHVWKERIISLPTDTQWDFAGGGVWEYDYPWEHKIKSSPTEKLVNFSQKDGAPSVVGRFPEGASWVGCHDMSGNVLEWSRSFYNGDSNTQDEKIDRSIRGGCFFDNDVERSVRIADRRGRKPAYRHSAIGFRIVVEYL